MSAESCGSSDADTSNGKNQFNSDQKILKTSSLRIQNKTFYIDLKENSSGVFIKIAEVSRNKQRSHITLPISIASSFQKKLSRALEIHLDTLEEDIERDKLFSEIIVKENRRYYIDLKENTKGRFLRVAMVNKDFRMQISIPIEGFQQFIDTYKDIISEYSSNQSKLDLNMPESLSLKLDSKTFYFDFGSNQYGSFVRVSEVRKLSRTAITIPDIKLDEFCQIIEKCREQIGQIKFKRSDSEKEKNTNEIKSENEDSKVSAGHIEAFQEILNSS